MKVKALTCINRQTNKLSIQLIIYYRTTFHSLKNQ